jgi:hypothetical protein
MVNQRIAQDLLRVLEAAPEKHDQNTWGKVTACGTTMCAAGHVCVSVMGDTPLWTQEVELNDFDELHAVNQFHLTHVNHHGKIDAVFDRAKDVLDLTFGEAEALFYTMNKEEVVRTVRAWANGEDPWA